MKENEQCTLCQIPIVREAYRDEDKLFCCAGCQSVYQILEVRSALVNFQNHPLFKQALRAGLISNPDLIEQLKQADQAVSDQEIKKIHLEIQEMWCPSCAQVIRLILLREKGIRQCIVDYTTDLASIEFFPRDISEEKVLKIIESLGYRPVALGDPSQKAVSRSLYLRFMIAAFFALNIMMFSYPIYASYFDADLMDYSTLFGWLSLVSSIPILTYSAWPIWQRLGSAARVGVWGMEVLVLLGVSTATGLSIYQLFQGSHYIYFDSMSVIIVFVLLGKIIESKAKFSAKDALIQLTRALPRRGRKRLADGSSCFVPLKDVHPGDFLVILSGEKIVLDGKVEEGEGACDESLMTGESLPVRKSLGSTVLAGTILQQGHLVIKVTATLEETTLQRIIEMIEQDIGHKSQYVRAADQIVRWFVPIVLGLAFCVALYCVIFQVHDGNLSNWQTALLRATSIVLISCPCAIGIAAPLAEAYVLNAMAKKGVIVRNRGCLPWLGHETYFICDKTGTVTEGKFTVLEGLEKLNPEDKAYLKGLVEKSNHPIAVALQQALFLVEGTVYDFVEEVVGRGIQGKKDHHSYFLGSKIFLEQQGLIIPPLLDKFCLNGVYTKVYFSNGKVLIPLILGDKIRAEVKELLASFALTKKLLVSGDSADCVEYVAQTCGFDAWRAGYHPLQKRELIDELRKRGETVVMVGDGINDAPSLTAAHIGIAVVSATDISIQVSDILLTTPKLSVIALVRQIATKGHQIVKQNLFWAFFYNCLGIGLAAMGMLSPLFAAFAMIVSSLIVLFNAQRLHNN